MEFIKLYFQLKNGIKLIVRKIDLLKKIKLKLKFNSYRLNFRRIYKNNLFKGDSSISGRGSNLDQTIVLREELVPLLRKLDIKKLLDVPCGDFNWMRHIKFEDIEYIGGDIVKKLVKENINSYSSKKCNFLYIDLTSSKLPEADTIFCRDCLVHLNYKQIFNALKNIKRSNIKYLMATTFSDREENIDLSSGIWRPLNLCKAPFNFPEPIELLNEKCPEGNGEWHDKCVGVWKVDDIVIK